MFLEIEISYPLSFPKQSANVFHRNEDHLQERVQKHIIINDWLPQQNSLRKWLMIRNSKISLKPNKVYALEHVSTTFKLEFTTVTFSSVLDNVTLFDFNCCH